MEEEEGSAGAATLLQEAAALEHPLSDRGVTSVAAAGPVAVPCRASVEAAAGATAAAAVPAAVEAEVADRPTSERRAP